MPLLYELAARTGLPQPAPAAEPDAVHRPGHATRTAATPTAARRRGASTPTATSAPREPAENADFSRRSTSTRACSSSTPTSRRSGYFFPPNEDAVHHEISQFAIDFIQNDIGPVLQQMFNDQSGRLPQLQRLRPVRAGVRRHGPGAADGRGGHDLREGHRARSTASRSTTTTWRWTTTINVTSRDKVEICSTSWVKQWDEATSRAPSASCSRTSWSARCTREITQPAAEHRRLRLLLPAGPARGRHGAADRAT